MPFNMLCICGITLFTPKHDQTVKHRHGNQGKKKSHGDSLLIPHAVNSVSLHTCLYRHQMGRIQTQAKICESCHRDDQNSHNDEMSHTLLLLKQDLDGVLTPTYGQPPNFTKLSCICHKF